MKATQEEKAAYNNYTDLMKEHKMTPRPIKEWIVIRRTAQARIKRAKENKGAKVQSKS
jgi:hypothetical protein